MQKETYKMSHWFLRNGVQVSVETFMGATQVSRCSDTSCRLQWSLKPLIPALECLMFRQNLQFNRKCTSKNEIKTYQKMRLRIDYSPTRP